MTEEFTDLTIEYDKKMSNHKFLRCATPFVEAAQKAKMKQVTFNEMSKDASKISKEFRETKEKFLYKQYIKYTKSSLIIFTLIGIFIAFIFNFDIKLLILNAISLALIFGYVKYRTQYKLPILLEIQSQKPRYSVIYDEELEKCRVERYQIIDQEEIMTLYEVDTENTVEALNLMKRYAEYE